ncbi:MAG: 23S rRNA (pseudouridine1915-N3)-methyltransferase [Salibacteraceae bacterium]|jgi:23S rRNA (pseudouridine1915-N3)-methyltransferase
MKITVVVVGKTQDKSILTLMEEYKKRLRHYIKLDWIEIPDYKNRGKVSSEELKRIEGQVILSKLSSGDELFLLDEKGLEHTSVQLSGFFKKKMNSGIKNLVFVIGGAYGFSDEVYAKANGKLALSKLTFPHQLIRVFILEQVYRGFTIIKGEPYHHD